MTHLVVALQIHEWDLPLHSPLPSLVTKLATSMIVEYLQLAAIAALQL